MQSLEIQQLIKGKHMWKKATDRILDNSWCQLQGNNVYRQQELKIKRNTIDFLIDFGGITRKEKKE
jgi:hypothetical protein